MRREFIRSCSHEVAHGHDSAWEDVNRVFRGHDYDEFLDLDEEEEAPEQHMANVEEMFEPSEIKARMMTHEDDPI
ncbi:hypothetical protein CALVIDRAFT_568642 [Calocera viscosa TUFC12733]|uniref:Uncharacterized protein n=1 Tax=Calocera viscosa (strain TUFC12733) TaxID=1330018 RepID=A0A167GW28_CALVF|nr:hypothetical protein CALVIDRAFT_568642 [Calocera viscosa TUFC12733]